MTPLMNGCCNDDMIQLGPLRSVIVSVRSDQLCVFCTTFLAILPTNQIWQIWGHSRQSFGRFSTKHFGLFFLDTLKKTLRLQTSDKAKTNNASKKLIYLYTTLILL